MCLFFFYHWLINYISATYLSKIALFRFFFALFNFVSIWNTFLLGNLITFLTILRGKIDANTPNLFILDSSSVIQHLCLFMCDLYLPTDVPCLDDFHGIAEDV